MFSEKALLQVKVLEELQFVDPHHFAGRVLDSMAGVRIVEHYLSGSAAAVDIDLPEYSRTVPEFASSDSVVEDCRNGSRNSETVCQEADEIVVREIPPSRINQLHPHSAE